MRVRDSPFALRVVRRREGKAAILYRRSLEAPPSPRRVCERRTFDRPLDGSPSGTSRERLIRVASISPLAFAAGEPLLRAAVRAASGPAAELTEGPFHPLDHDWGARVACYALVATRLRNADRLCRAAANLQYADGSEAAWWFGLMGNGKGRRAIRALRILVEAVP